MCDAFDSPLTPNRSQVAELCSEHDTVSERETREDPWLNGDHSSLKTSSRWALKRIEKRCWHVIDQAHGDISYAKAQAEREPDVSSTPVFPLDMPARDSVVDRDGSIAAFRRGRAGSCC